MKKLYVEESALDLVYTMLKENLQDANIDFLEKNDFPAGINIYIGNAKKEIWILDDSLHKQGQEILQKTKMTLKKKANSKGWTCPQCGEQLDGNFEICWKCSHVR